MGFRDRQGGRAATGKEGEKVRGVDGEVGQVRLGRRSRAGRWQGLGCAEREIGTSPGPVTNNPGIVFVPEMYSYFPPGKASAQEHSSEFYYLQNWKDQDAGALRALCTRSRAREDVSAALCPAPRELPACRHLRSEASGGRKRRFACREAAPL